MLTHPATIIKLPPAQPMVAVTAMTPLPLAPRRHRTPVPTPAITTTKTNPSLRSMLLLTTKGAAESPVLPHLWDLVIIVTVAMVVEEGVGRGKSLVIPCDNIVINHDNKVADLD